MSQANRENTSNMNTTHSKQELQSTSDYEHDVQLSLNESRNSPDDDLWVLQIKMVGNETNQSDFRISLHPNDDIIQLYQEITNITDIPYHRQRLIYRGRLLPHIHHSSTATTPISTKRDSATREDVSLLQERTVEGEGALMSIDSTDKKVAAMTGSTRIPQHLLLNQKVRDIVGLMNGHAIHLVVRHNESRTVDDDDDEEEGDENNVNNEDDLTANITADPASTTSSSSSSSTGSTSLLAALLGMGTGGRSNDPTTGATTSSRGPTRRHPSYRLSEEDWIRPDPGSLETVRQGLMTFHTLQQVHSTTANTNVNRHNNDPLLTSMSQPPQSNRYGRHFYLGQWIDCRDTVNQWLEATVVRILYPRDIMHSYHTTSTTGDTSPSVSTCSDDSNRNSNGVSFPFLPTADPPIAVTDFDGRRRLLLEPCSESEAEECIDGEHYRRRSNNDNVQILHIHYNGWPVRWDEWIRSDSERIRVFRTRTRHHPSPVDQGSPRYYMSPNIDTIMPDAPHTYITENEQSDRSALLSELHRALHTLENRIAAVSESTITTTTTNSHSVRTSRMNHLPWTTGTDAVSTATSEGTNLTDSQVQEPKNQRHNSQPALTRQEQRRELEALAPLLDRLGRVLIDAAPHVLALVDGNGREDEDDDDDYHDAAADDDNDVEYDTDETDPQDEPPATNTLGGLLSLLNRDRRSVGRGSVASGSNVALPSVVSDAEISTVASSSTTTTDVVVHPTEANSSTDLVTRNISGPDEDHEVETSDDNVPTMEFIDPDYRDYAAGLVNTSRGDVRSTNGGGSLSNRRGSSSDDGSTSLLGAYLAAMSLGGIASVSTGDRDEGDGVAEGLGRLFRDRGAASGGIDIHIHAVVTSPGLDGAIGFAALTGGGGGGAFPVATPVRGPDTPTNTTGGFGSLFGGSLSQRRGGSRRFRSTTATSNDARNDEQPVVDETNNIEDDLDLFADLYSETPDPINPRNATYPLPTVTAVSEPDEGTVANREASTPSTSPLRQHRPLSLRRIHAIHVNSNGGNLDEQYQHSTPRSYRDEQRHSNSNDQRYSGNGNNNLLRRFFRRPDGNH